MIGSYLDSSISVNFTFVSSSNLLSNENLDIFDSTNFDCLLSRLVIVLFTGSCNFMRFLEERVSCNFYSSSICHFEFSWSSRVMASSSYSYSRVKIFLDTSMISYFKDLYWSSLKSGFSGSRVFTNWKLTVTSFNLSSLMFLINVPFVLSLEHSYKVYS